MVGVATAEGRSSDAVQDTDADVLLELLAYLKGRDYHFVTPTPATHARVLARASRRNARDLRDIFGWTMRFDSHLLDSGLRRDLDQAGWIEREEDGFKSRLRVASLGDDLFLHSAYPTDDPDAVFFGPDSYRFARLITQELERDPTGPILRLVDMGAGAGVGAIIAAHLRHDSEIVMTDINPAALDLARVNAQAAGVTATFYQTGDLSSVPGEFDLILANPPYIIDDECRAYRNGGNMLGGQVSLEMAQQAVPRLVAGGRLILYTGTSIVEGEDRLLGKLSELAEGEGCTLTYREIDPDVFGEELEKEAYRNVERIAIVAGVIERCRQRSG